MTLFSINLYGFTIAPTYYGLMYLIGFLAGYYIIKKRNKIFINIMDKSLTKLLLDDLVFYIFLGVILGGRIGYVLFYNFSHYFSNPIDILKVWEGGMSFHGGVLGVIFAMWLFVRKYRLNFLNVADQVTSILPIGIGLGRIGNYLNKELLGFSNYYGPLSVNGRFPSPLLEFLLEGVVLYIILNYFYKRKIFHGQIAALFLIFYGIFRIFIELFFREPDVHIGYIYGFLTIGEILTIPMVIFGLFYYFYLKHNEYR